MMSEIEIASKVAALSSVAVFEKYGTKLSDSEKEFLLRELEFAIKERLTELEGWRQLNPDLPVETVIQKQAGVAKGIMQIWDIFR